MEHEASDIFVNRIFNLFALSSLKSEPLFINHTDSWANTVVLDVSVDDFRIIYHFAF